MEVGGKSTDLGWRDRDAEFEKPAVAHFMKEPESAAPDGTSGDADAPTTEFPRILDRGDPLACARRFLADKFSCDDHQTLYHHRGGSYSWIRSRWRLVDEAELRARLYEYLESSFVRVSVGRDKFENVAFKPSTRRVADVLDALKSAAFLSGEVNPPAWLEPVADLPPDELVPCCNGLIHLPEMQLLGQDPEFFNLSALAVAYDPHADESRVWLAFFALIVGR